MVLIQQIAALIDFLESHPQLARGQRSRGLETRMEGNRRWAECATLLNSISPNCPTKSVNEWRKFYNEYKHKLVKKIKLLKQEIRTTGGGPAKKIILTPYEERLYTILGRDLGDPLEGVRHEPFPEPTPEMDVVTTEPMTGSTDNSFSIILDDYQQISLEQEAVLGSLQLPSTVQEQVPSTMQEQDSSTTQEQSPSTMQDQGPTTTWEQGPSRVQEQGSSAMQEQDSSTTQEQSLLEDQGPTTTWEQGPSRVQEQGPTITREQGPSRVPPARASRTREARRRHARQHPNTEEIYHAALEASQERLERMERRNAAAMLSQAEAIINLSQAIDRLGERTLEAVNNMAAATTQAAAILAAAIERVAHSGNQA